MLWGAEFAEMSLVVSGADRTSFCNQAQRVTNLSLCRGSSEPLVCLRGAPRSQPGRNSLLKGAGEVGRAQAGPQTPEWEALVGRAAVGGAALRGRQWAGPAAGGGRGLDTGRRRPKGRVSWQRRVDLGLHPGPGPPGSGALSWLVQPPELGFCLYKMGMRISVSPVGSRLREFQARLHQTLGISFPGSK